MKIFEIDQLPVYQQEIILPVIKKQKKYEKIKLRILPFFMMIWWSIHCLVLLIGLLSLLKDCFLNNFTFDHLLIFFMMILMSLIFGIFELLIICFYKKTIKNTNLNDFYIIYGKVDDKSFQLVCDDEDNSKLYILYSYIIDGKCFHVEKSVFRHFRYRKIPVGEYRYLLLRKHDNAIRKDLTKYF